MAASEVQPGAIAMPPAELAELLAAFNEVTSRLQGTHERLTAEVQRLTRELTEANRQLERSRRLAALGEMAAGIAHEVRNPLGAIRLYARMLDEELGDRPASQETARKIGGAARGLDQIVGDMLTFAREFRVRAAPVDAEDLIEQSLAACMHDGVPGWRELEVVREGGAADVALLADAGLAQQAMVNVIRNAIEAIADARAGSAGPRLLTLGAACEPGDDGRAMVAVRVSDTGPGVSDETVARMFNPFYTTRATGTGLGLAIVHRIMDAHGGQVRIRNNASDGSAPGATVELVFPSAAVGGSGAEVSVVGGAGGRAGVGYVQG